MSGMRGWKIRRNALCASGILFRQNQSPAIMLAEAKRGKGGDVKWQEGGERVEGGQN